MIKYRVHPEMRLRSLAENPELNIVYDLTDNPGPRRTNMRRRRSLNRRYRRRRNMAMGQCVRKKWKGKYVTFHQFRKIWRPGRGKWTGKKMVTAWRKLPVFVRVNSHYVRATLRGKKAKIAVAAPRRRRRTAPKRRKAASRPRRKRDPFAYLLPSHYAKASNRSRRYNRRRSLFRRYR